MEESAADRENGLTVVQDYCSTVVLLLLSLASEHKRYEEIDFQTLLRNTKALTNLAVAVDSNEGLSTYTAASSPEVEESALAKKLAELNKEASAKNQELKNVRKHLSMMDVFMQSLNTRVEAVPKQK